MANEKPNVIAKTYDDEAKKLSESFSDMLVRAKEALNAAKELEKFCKSRDDERVVRDARSTQQTRVDLLQSSISGAQYITDTAAKASSEAEREPAAESLSVGEIPDVAVAKTEATITPEKVAPSDSRQDKTASAAEQVAKKPAAQGRDTRYAQRDSSTARTGNNASQTGNNRPAAGGAARSTYRDNRDSGTGRPPYSQQRQSSGTGTRPAGNGGSRPTGQGSRPTGGAYVAPAAIPVSTQKDRVSNYDPNRAAYNKPRDNDKQHVKNKKTIMREAAPVAVFDDDTPQMGNRRKVRRGSQTQTAPHKVEPIVIDHAVISTETISVKDLSEKIGKPVSSILKKMLSLGILANINQDIPFDVCELVAADYNITLELQLTKTYEDVLSESADEVDTDENTVIRPPVITIMGHVDHGKTSLLDAIRHSSVTEGEAGGITQHIGAYTVNCNDKQITFIDTPGHEAFTSMRARGAQVTDIVILVVAADDGIMPQTIEAINHAKAAEVPIIVAVNKIDKPTAQPDRVKQQLTEHGLLIEEWGGDVICVNVSAKTKQGLDSLLEMVLLQAEVLELRANPARLAKGTIIEAELHKSKGPVATILVQNGTLHVGDAIVAGTAYGKVRAMTDDKGRTVTSAGPSCPVQVLGFSEVPSAGDTMNVVGDDKLSRHVADERRDKQKAEAVKQSGKVSLDDLFNQIAEGEVKDLNVIIKADVRGSAEAVKQALEKLSTEQVRVRCIQFGVGAISSSDILLASASNAIVIGFNVRPDSGAKADAEREGVDVRTYSIIYNAIDDVKNAMLGLYAPEYKEVELGKISVRQVFKVSGVGTIAGCYVQEGKVTRGAQVRVVRNGIVIHDGKMASLKRVKDDVKEVATGYECGIGIENFNNLEVGDTIEAYLTEEVKRTSID